MAAVATGHGGCVMAAVAMVVVMAVVAHGGCVMAVVAHVGCAMAIVACVKVLQTQLCLWHGFVMFVHSH